MVTVYLWASSDSLGIWAVRVTHENMIVAVGKIEEGEYPCISKMLLVTIVTHFWVFE